MIDEPQRDVRPEHVRPDLEPTTRLDAMRELLAKSKCELDPETLPSGCREVRFDDTTNRLIRLALTGSLSFLLSVAPAHGQTPQEKAAAAMAALDSPANFTRRPPLVDMSGPTVAIAHSHTWEGPYGPFSSWRRFTLDRPYRDNLGYCCGDVRRGGLRVSQPRSLGVFDDVHLDVESRRVYHAGRLPDRRR